jgi:hypothetical protein
MENRDMTEKRWPAKTKPRWREAKLGMSIHRGLYAIAAGIWKGRPIIVRLPACGAGVLTLEGPARPGGAEHALR